MNQAVDVSGALYAVEAAIAGRLVRQELPAPGPLDRAAWPPDYARVFAWRQQQLARFADDPDLLAAARAYYAGSDLAGVADPAPWAERTVAFICHWCDTYDPRLTGSGRAPRMPMVLFRRQAEMVHFIYACMMGDAPGLVEKSRDMGATWVAGAVTVKEWTFQPGFAAGWGSNKAEQVDVLGNPKSIFEKLRMLIRWLPPVFRPAVLEGTDLKQHTCRNPETGAVIDGEIGKNIGRGGRSRVYFVDEAQPLDAQVLTPLGFRAMADLRVGDQVLGGDGEPKTITQVKDCGVHDVYRVTLSDGTWTECSPNHLWAVEDVIGKRKSKTLRARQIASTLRNRHGQYRYRLPSRPVAQFSEQKSALPLDAYIVGALLGNGTLGADGAARLTTPDVELVEEFRRLMPAGCVLNQAAEIEFRFVGSAGRLGRAVGGSYFKSVAKGAVLAAGIAGCRSWEKFIPKGYLLAPPSERLALLQGLMDTDGYGVGTSFHTCSPRLADDVRFLVQSLGGSATLRIAPSKAGFRTMYALTIKMPEGVELFRTSRKRGKRPPRKTDVGRTILSVVPVGRRPVRCISIDDPSGLYLTDHCIVTHNSAHLEHPESVEASLSENTRCRIDMSSVSGPGTVFYRKRQAGVEWSPGAPIYRDRTNVFVMDWSDHPEKDAQWYARRRAYYDIQGTPEVVAREIDRDYMGAMQGVIIRREWVEAAVGAHEVIPGLDKSGGRWAALDVADEGVDTNALVGGQGAVADYAEEWGERDPGATARRAFRTCRGLLPHPVVLQYDCIGLGTNVKSEFNRLTVDDGADVSWIRLVAWAANAAVFDPGGPVIPGDKNSPTNKNYFENFKAQAWWLVGRMFYKTWRMVEAIEGRLADGAEAPDYSPDELVAIDARAIPPAVLAKLKAELCQPVMTQSSRLKLMVAKAPDGAKSPNLGDAFVMGRCPARGAPPPRVGMFGPKIL